MECVECGGIIVRMDYEKVCSSCGLVVEDISFEYPSSFNFNKNSGVLKRRNLVILGRIGKNYSPAVVKRSEEILEEMLRARIFFGVSLSKLSKVAIYFAIEELGGENIKLNKIEKKILKKARYVVYGEKRARNLDEYIEKVERIFSYRFTCEEREKIVQICNYLNGKGCSFKNSAMTAIFLLLSKKKAISLKSFSKKTGVSAGRISILRRKVETFV